MNSNRYYDDNAELFFNSTFQVDMKPIYDRFTQYLPMKADILDVGCGSGRDALYFKHKGYSVTAFDYSAELVKLAQEKTGLAIQHRSFYDIDEHEKYDAIWACASLLHCERSRLVDVIKKISNALRLNGIAYLSFKYGEQDRIKEGRYFTDLNEVQTKEILDKVSELTLIDIWISDDNRTDRNDKWLNLIVKKEG